VVPAVLRSLSVPVIQGPMAGGAATPELAAAVSEAGGLGFLAAGYKSAAAVAEQAATLRAMTVRPFGVNLFVPGADTGDRTALELYRQRLSRDAAALGAEPGDPVWRDDDWHAKLGLLAAQPVPVVSFTFGCPPASVVANLRRRDSVVIVTVTDPAEARQAEDAGADALCVQGAEAGAHQASFDDTRERTTPLLDLLAAVGSSVRLPLIAAGGLMSAAHVTAALGAGAVAAQLGTAFLRCPESGASPAHRAALADPRYAGTVVTRAFSGRRARGLVNGFIRAHHGAAPAAYPQVHYLTAPLRAAAARAGDADRLNLWAGTRHALAEERPAAEVVAAVSGGVPRGSR
jgi:nitronate monooxygenase